MIPTPYGQRILIDVLGDEPQEGSAIVLPEGRGHGIDQELKRVKVVQLGTGMVDNNGNRVPFDVQIGDTLLVEPQYMAKFRVGGKEYTIMNEAHIVVIIGRGVKQQLDGKAKKNGKSTRKT